MVPIKHTEGFIMTEQQIPGQIDLIDGTEVTESTEFNLTDFVTELVGNEDGITSYGTWKIMTEGFRALGIDQNRPSQMMYNYTRNGMIAKRTKGMAGKDVRYTRDEVIEFLVKFYTKHTS